MHEHRCRPAGAGARVGEIVDLETGLAADVEEAVRECDASLGLTRGQRADEILACDLQVADVVR
jgi:hypothetical protein